MAAIQFRTRSKMPERQVRAPRLHPDTKRIIDQLGKAKGRVVECSGFRTPTHAKRRLDAIRRAKARGRVQYKSARRVGTRLYFRLR